MTHTPGPWYVLDMRPASDRISVGSGHGIVCRISNEISGDPLSEEDAANAMLISAAPEMKDRLSSAYETMLDAVGYEMPEHVQDKLIAEMEEIQKTLEKARG